MTADQCQYGLISKGEEGHGAVMESTGFMTNALHIVEQLQADASTNQEGSIIGT